MIDETQTYDVVVVGGGLAAICAAIQAARLGCSVVLIEKDPVLGGNGGPLLGVHPSGAHSFHPYASELGIVGEIIEEAAWQRAKIRTHGQHYNTSQQYETVLKQKLDEAGVTVYRRTYGRDAETVELPGGRKRITAVIAEDTARFRTVRFEAKVGVIDGSGDGHVAMKSGASFRKGREAKSETGERSALDVADDITLGTSLTALCRRCSEPVEFIPPPGTPPFEAGYGRSIVQGPSGKPLFRYSSWNANAEFCFLWITETGGQLDTIDDDHLIYEELLKQVYSAWASLKAEEPAAANWELTWISPKAGKRESRRFVGDVVVTQTDVENDTPWPDAVCFGGYSVDIHNPSGTDLKQVTIVFYSIPPLWSMPYRALYSKDVANLWLAGRLASVTHLGLGSWRLQRTMAGGGQAVGVAAALAKKHGCDNRGIFTDHLTELQQTILRHDGAIVRVPGNDPNDLARAGMHPDGRVKHGAFVEASSETEATVERADRWEPLDKPRGVQLWSWIEWIEQTEVYLRNETDEAKVVELTISLHQPETPWKDSHSNLRFPYERVGNRMEWGADNSLTQFAALGSATAEVPAGFEGWVSFELVVNLPDKDPASDEPRVNLVLSPAEGVSWAVQESRVDFARRLSLEPEADAYDGAADSHLYRILPAPEHGQAYNVVNGWNRRFSTNPVNAWVAAEPGEAWLALDWYEYPVTIAEVQVTFDTLTRAYTEMPFDCEQRVSPMCVRDYRIEVQVGDDWRELVAVKDNYHRVRRHRCEPVETERLRIVVERVWDESIPARIYEVRCYGPGGEA